MTPHTFTCRVNPECPATDCLATDCPATDAPPRRTPAEIRQMLREIAFVLNMTRRVRQEIATARRPLSVAASVADADHPPRPELFVGG